MIRVKITMAYLEYFHYQKISAVFSNLYLKKVLVGK